MPPLATSDRVASFVARLSLLGNAARGDLIRAQVWNDLIGLVTEIAQALLALQSEDHVPPHEHVDEVKITWLDPALRALVEKGPLSDPTSVQRFLTADRRVEAFADDLEHVRQATESAQARLAELATRELTRDATVIDVRRAVEGFDARKDAVLQLRQSLDSIQTKVDLAIRASERLVINGQPADLQALNGRLVAVEQLRDALKLPNGQLLDATAFEQRLAGIRNDVVTQKQLDDAFKQHQIDVPQETVDFLHTSLATSLRGELSQDFETLRGEVTGSVDTKLATFDATLGDRIGDRVTDAVKASATDLQASIDASATKLRGEFGTTADKSAQTASDALRGELEGAIAAVQASLGGAVKTALDQALPGRFTEIQTALNAVRDSANAAVAKVNAQADAVAAAKTRAEQISLDLTTALNSARTDLLKEMDRRDTVNQKAVDKRFVDLDSGLDARIDKRLNPRVTQLQTDTAQSMQKTATDAANSALNAARVQLNADMTAIARDQALALKDTVAASVKADLDPVINSRIDNAVKLKLPHGTGGIGGVGGVGGIGGVGGVVNP